MVYGESRIKLLISFVIASLFTLIFSVAGDFSSHPEAFNTLILIKVFLILLVLCVLIFGRDNVFIKIELEKPNNDDAVQEEDDSKVLKIVGKDLAKALNRKKPLSRGEIKKIIEVLDEYGL